MAIPQPAPAQASLNAPGIAELLLTPRNTGDITSPELQKTTKKQIEAIKKRTDAAVFKELTHTVGLTAYMSDLLHQHRPGSAEDKALNMFADRLAHHYKTEIRDKYGVKTPQDVITQWKPEMKEAFTKLTQEEAYEVWKVVKKELWPCTDSSLRPEVKDGDDIVRLNDLDVYTALHSYGSPQQTLKVAEKLLVLKRPQVQYLLKLLSSKETMDRLNTKQELYRAALETRLADRQLAQKADIPANGSSLQEDVRHVLNGHPNHASHCEISM